MDRLILGFDRALRTLGGVMVAQREYPATSEDCLPAGQQRLSAALMRVNHSGEVCAQALYQGQALLARDQVSRGVLERAAAEEADHLDWTARRLVELGGRKSLLDPFWYAGAFSIGAAAAMIGDRVSLGFLSETERQVVVHLEGHLERLPVGDQRSRQIVVQMRDDEAAHADLADSLGAVALPMPVPLMMRAAAGVMTAVAYFV
jgi:3-demethoxyubiquinol 3-hydroxylase